MRDYCTWWPDGVPSVLGGNGHEWSHCCEAHDMFYNIYVGWFGYYGAHAELGRCVAAAGFPAMGSVMVAGLSTIGMVYAAYIQFKKRLKK